MPIKRKNTADDPLWFKDAIFYELRLRSFADSNNDGIGDFVGATQKLDYLQDLGVTVLWLLPFYPSPGRDDGYDIADYLDVHPDVGTLDDFKMFLDEAHRRGLRVMTELVVNHTSDLHPWFQRARRAPAGSPERDFYVWSDTPNRYQEARIIFKDFETSNWTWDPVANAYFWHRFYSHQPDLNYDNPAVQQAVMETMDFWLDLGVDGLRLDAVPYLYEREGTNCENLPETHAFLQKLRSHMDSKYGDRVLLAEANQWPEDAVIYFGKGDECHMAFHFPIMPRLFMSIHMEDRYPIVDILHQTPDIPANCQWAIFLRNHDELTLEMVTEEERDYMYRVYAGDRQARINLGIRRRLAPLLGNDRKRIELLNALLFSLPGTPVLYYGDEIGMGDNFYLGDRNGVRTPMQWNADRNAGFSRVNPQKLFLPVIVDPQYHYETINVETQQQNPHSLLWWTKRMLALRKQYTAFGRGSMEMLNPENASILAFVRRYNDETILVVCNLSRFVQYTDLDLAPFKDSTPVELFSGQAFPPVNDRPYFFMLGPHSFYWFKLQPVAQPETSLGTYEHSSATLNVAGAWTNILHHPEKAQLEAVLPSYLRERHWFGSQDKHIINVEVKETFAIPDTAACLLLINVNYRSADDETWLLTIGFATGEQMEQLRQRHRSAIISQLVVETDEQLTAGVLFDAIGEPAVCSGIVRMIHDKKRLRGSGGKLVAEALPELFEVWDEDAIQHPTVLGYEQSNTSIRFVENVIFKLMRKVPEGINPELEIGRYLNQKSVNTPPLLGSLEYEPARGERMSLGILQGYVSNQGDAWRYTLRWLGRYLEDALMRSAEETISLSLPAQTSLIQLTQESIPATAEELLGSYLKEARILGQRVGEMHVALASDTDNDAFKPEPFSKLYQRSLYQSLRNTTNRVLKELRTKRRTVAEAVVPVIDDMLNQENRLLNTFMQIADKRLSGMRIRVHGDLHLGQVLYCDGDFTIIDFEGKPEHPLSERRLKRSPLRDVAEMLRCFHYAAYAALPGYGMQSMARQEDFQVLEPWAQFWQIWTSVAFLQSYTEVVMPIQILPNTLDEWALLLRLFLLERAVYEASYEVNHRPNWLRIPVQGIMQQFEAAE